MAWDITTDTFQDLYALFGSTSQSSINGFGGVSGNSAARMYGLLNLDTNATPQAPLTGDRMSDWDGVDNIIWTSGPTYTGVDGGLRIEGTIDPNGSNGFFNFQAINEVIFGSTPPTNIDWNGETVPTSTDGDTFGETGFISVGQNSFVVDETIDGLVHGAEHYVHVLYYNGFNSLAASEWIEDFDDTQLVTPTTIVLTTPSIISFTVDTPNNEFDASWTNPNDTSEFDDFQVTISGQFGGSQTFTYSNTVTSVTNEDVTNFFYSPGETITMEIQARDNNNTNSGTDSATDTA